MIACDVPAEHDHVGPIKRAVSSLRRSVALASTMSRRFRSRITLVSVSSEVVEDGGIHAAERGVPTRAGCQRGDLSPRARPQRAGRP